MNVDQLFSLQTDYPSFESYEVDGSDVEKDDVMAEEDEEDDVVLAGQGAQAQPEC